MSELPDQVSLSASEARVLGCLIEKEATTPEYYPLSLNALTNACNQSTNRYPVVQYSEETVTEALDTLREKNLAILSSGAGSRVHKFRHLADAALDLDRPALALLAILLLRGPQTLGELRSRSERLHAFSSSEELQHVLDAGLINRAPSLATLLPRNAGQKERRYSELLSVSTEASTASAMPEDDGQPLSSSRQQFLDLQSEVKLLREEVQHLREAFLTFKKEFEND